MVVAFASVIWRYLRDRADLGDESISFHIESPLHNSSNRRRRCSQAFAQVGVL